MVKIILITLFFFFGVFNVEMALSQSQCTIGVTPVSFGNYETFSSIPTDATGTITVNCGFRVVRATVTLGVSSTSGTFNPRRMKRSTGSDLLDYNIYTDTARTVIFGDGTGGTSNVLFRRPTGPPRDWSETVTTYARIPPGQNVSVGAYSDTLTATVTP